MTGFILTREELHPTLPPITIVFYYITINKHLFLFKNNRKNSKQILEHFFYRNRHAV